MPPSEAGADARSMRMALAMARRAVGTTAPNPPVGCVLIADGIVVGRGATQPGGRPHAETVALTAAGERARGATAYVTLEPCSHHGVTPPCADALIAAGVGRVVVACVDPDARVSGAGLRRLRDAGIPVSEGLLAEEAAQVLAGFFSRLDRGRPTVTLKIASTLDARIATDTGQSQWITGEAARAHGHWLRARHDAIVVGSGTILADNPQLTCRLPGLDRLSPIRIVVDRRLRTPLTAGLIATARQRPTWIVTLDGAQADRRRAFEDCGVRVMTLDPEPGGIPNLPQAMHLIAGAGVNSLLVEGGETLATAFLRDRLVDRIYWYRSPRLIGGDGIRAVGPLGVDTLARQLGFRRAGLRPMGDDVLEILEAEA